MSKAAECLWSIALIFVVLIIFCLAILVFGNSILSGDFGEHVRQWDGLWADFYR